MLSQYRAVFFDVGGTLLKVHPSVGEVYTRHARPFGFAGSPDEVELRFRDAWTSVGGIESLGTQRGEAIEKKFWKDLVWQTFESLGGLRDFDAYFARVYDAFREKDAWRVYDDVAESRLLETLKQRGVVLGVVSNWDSRLADTLANLDLARHFDFILASTVVGSAKPQAGIFLEALRQSGVPAEAACHIGDEVQSDFEGARGAGLDAILVDRKDRYTGNGAVAPRVRSFLELV